MTEDDLLPVAARHPRPPLRRRRSRRQGLLAAGLTGLVVTGSVPGGESRLVAPAAADVDHVDHQPDPAPLFGVDLSEILTIAHQQAATAAGEPLSTVLEGRSAVARWDGVEIFADGDRTELVGFHESNNAEALPLDATRPIATSHHHGVSVPTTGEADGQIIVLPTRDRGSGPMTAMDLAVQPDETVLSPVDGVVVEVAPIQYRGPDHKITIRPHANRAAEISVIHVNGPLVEAGDQVRGSQTPIAATPRQLPFESQVDRFTEAARGAPAPHVHVELRAVEPAA